MADENYTGSCHCGSVRYEVRTALDGAISCNCSMCSRTGAVMVFVPAEQFQLLSGEDALSDYQFNKRNIHHVFCSTCGVRSFSRGTGPGGKPMCAVNVRCLEGVDVDSLKIERFDGRSL
jgi:hypothetical protein